MINHSIYILRCWKDDGVDKKKPGRVRFRLEDPHTGENHLFTNAMALHRFLIEQLDPDSLTDDFTGDSDADI